MHFSTRLVALTDTVTSRNIRCNRCARLAKRYKICLIYNNMFEDKMILTLFRGEPKCGGWQQLISTNWMCFTVHAWEDSGPVNIRARKSCAKPQKVRWCQSLHGWKDGDGWDMYWGKVLTTSRGLHWRGHLKVRGGEVDLEKETNKLGWHTWRAAAASASYRDGWCDLLAGLKCPHGRGLMRMSELV